MKGGRKWHCVMFKDPILYNTSFEFIPSSNFILNILSNEICISTCSSHPTSLIKIFLFSKGDFLGFDWGPEGK